MGWEVWDLNVLFRTESIRDLDFVGRFIYEPIFSESFLP